MLRLRIIADTSTLNASAFGAYSKNQNVLCKIPIRTDRAVLIEYYYVTNSLLIFSTIPIMSFRVIFFF